MKRLTNDTISKRLKAMEYAVLGRVVFAAEQIEKDLSSPLAGSSYPFTKNIYTNVGNP